MRTIDRRISLNESFSLYLDLARFLAAAMVVITHCIQHKIIGEGAARFIPSLGREAVVTFFVLSGFVIAYVTSTKVVSARDYIVARSGRIYSVALPTLLIAWLFALVIGDGDYQLSKPYVYIPLHLMFLGQSWNFSEVPPLLGAYWSLCYEVWYYVLFGVVYFMRGWGRLVVTALVLGIMGFKLWLVLPVWLAGVAVYHLQDRIRMTRLPARVGFAASLILLLAYNLAGLEGVLRGLAVDIWPSRTFDLGSSERFLADYVVAVLVGGNFLCARYLDLGGLVKYGAAIRALANYTFTLYLAHMLVILAWLRWYPHNNTSVIDIANCLVLVALGTVVLAQITEQRKQKFQVPVAWFLAFFWPAKNEKSLPRAVV
ncbi:acyltransferase [Massilia sp. 9I]|uniref:acyltransferase family protein n=1 Tax=Massilia sp. 9I TaxID=2653152 RepID=UPI0012EFE901|nr:acyltransferase [Massilia sp. 9I]VXB33227.1 conserved membrane hypothetical protein [Massilia sp. 9I]